MTPHLCTNYIFGQMVSAFFHVFLCMLEDISIMPFLPGVPSTVLKYKQSIH